MRIDDQTLIAFADGELGPDERGRVAAALALDGALRDRLTRQQRLRNLVSGHYAPVVDEAVPERITALLATRGAEVVDLAAARARRSRPLWQDFTALAATLVLGLFAGRALVPGAGPIAVEDGAMIARGDLADALETRLASQPTGETRIGISFAAADGRVCRTFASPAMSGLACRGADRWQLMTTTAGLPVPQGQFRQAASGDPRVLEAAQALMIGEPFDAEAERRARDARWRNISPAD